MSMEQQSFFPLAVVTTRECVYTPFVSSNGQVGYEVRWPDGQVTFLYMNPSGETDDGQPNVFIYAGPTTDPNDGQPLVYVDVEREVQ